MNFNQLMPFRNMRQRLHTAVKRGRLAVLDIGSSKITCLVLKLDPARLAEAGRHDRLGTSLFGAVEVVGARTVQARGVRRGEIVDMDEVSRAIRLALLNSEKMAAPKVGRVDQVIVSFSGGRPQSFSTTAEVETETGQVTERDISNVLGACPEPPIGDDRQILHAQPVELSVDHQSGITDPRGMTGHRLAVAMHVMTVGARPLANLMECIRQCDLDLAGVVAAPYASGLSALVEDEQRTGAVCIDMGGGSTSFSVFLRDHLICCEQIRYGGDHVTSDIAAGLMMRTAAAERIKTLYGGVISTGADDRELIDAPQIGEEDAPERRQISRGMLIGVIRPRVEETFRLLRQRLVELGVTEMPGCSYVLTGASCQMPGVDEMATRILGRRPRIGRPIRIAGLPQALSGPDYSAAVGLATYALRPHDELWDFDAPRSLSARGRATEMIRWLKASW
ncbi:MAG TPA: cell division protein FtsA [Thermohalobaculum sp.]|nr:cell division protein FtsA [Thermohalobaculum sp.]